jgi:hypothetical protein
MNTRKYGITGGSEEPFSSRSDLEPSVPYTIPTLKDSSDHSSTWKKSTGARNNCAMHLDKLYFLNRTPAIHFTRR